jgi:hypothetical protein
MADWDAENKEKEQGNTELPHLEVAWKAAHLHDFQWGGDDMRDEGHFPGEQPAQDSTR